jgi:hypothetical protein
MIRPRSPDPPPPSLDEIVRRLRCLTPNWRDAERFYTVRDDLVDDLHRLARNGPPEVPGHLAGASPQVQRLAALLVLKNDEIRRLRKLLAEACRPRPRRRRVPDARQLVLTF